MLWLRISARLPRKCVVATVVIIREIAVMAETEVIEVIAEEVVVIKVEAEIETDPHHQRRRLDADPLQVPNLAPDLHHQLLAAEVIVHRDPRVQRNLALDPSLPRRKRLKSVDKGFGHDSGFVAGLCNHLLSYFSSL